jgi:hypothetical protein
VPSLTTVTLVVRVPRAVPVCRALSPPEPGLVVVRAHLALRHWNHATQREIVGMERSLWTPPRVWESEFVLV